MGNSSDLEIVNSEALEKKSEVQPISYEEYSYLCNEKNDGSRKRGILAEEFYEAVVTDPSTEYVDSKGKKIPVFMDIKYGLGMGYEYEKCVEYAAGLADKIKVLAFPIHEFGENELRQIVEILKSDEAFALYTSDHNGDELACLTALVQESEKTMTERPMLEPSANPGDKQAALYLYSCSIRSKELESGKGKKRLSDVKEYFDNHISNIFSFDGEIMTRLDLGSDISDEKAEKIWNLYDSIFEDLGRKNHPVSMQDSKEDFMGLLRTPNTLFAATYSRDQNGFHDNPICFTFFVDDFKSLYWLNQDYLNSKMDSGESITGVFTPGLVSSAEGSSHSMLSLGLFTKACDGSGINIDMFYENTNLSKRYIPRIVDRCCSRSCKDATYSGSVLLDEVKYRLLSIE